MVVNFPAAGHSESVTHRQVWGDVPARNPGFAGREELLGTVRATLAGGDRAMVKALCGMGGVGKTQLAIEYAHRYAPEYNTVWWIAADQPELIGGQITALGAALGCIERGDDNAAVRRAVLSELRERGRWLLVFDSAGNPEEITGWLPGGVGHVLVTSRAHGWEEVAEAVEIDVLERSESVALLRRRVPGLGVDGADLVAAAIGDLPLAIAQAAAYMASAGIAAAEYVRLVEARAAEILDAGRPASYPLSLAAVTQLVTDRLEAASPAAAQAVRVCAFLAPEPVPAEWFASVTEQFPDPLSAVVADPVAWGLALAVISGQSLARIDRHGLVMHRLTQAVIRTRLPPLEAAAARAQAAALLNAAHPGDSQLPSTWPAWARLLPHLLVLNPDAGVDALSDLTNDAVWYLIRLGTARNGRDLARRLYRHRLGQYGADAPGTLDAANSLAAVLSETGRHAAARELHEDTLTRRRRVLGEDHRDTLRSVGNLAVVMSGLAEYQAARALDEDVLARSRRVLGEDHPDTLAAACSLAADLSVLGELRAARVLDEDVLARRRRVLGEDHPDTLAAAAILSRDMSLLGRGSGWLRKLSRLLEP